MICCLAWPRGPADGIDTVSFQYQSWTSNAGGQQSYGLRWAIDESQEWALFSNQYLMAADLPLSGIVWDLIFPVSPTSCALSMWIQAGVGLSSAGPVVEFLWSIRPLWLFRIDFATHLYFSGPKPIVWNYPFWLGINIPF